MGGMRARYGSERAAMVQLGDSLVPELITLTREGDRGQPDLVANIEVRDGRPECTVLTITAKPDGRGIRLRDLDGFFSMDSLIVEQLGRFAVRPEPLGDGRKGGPMGGRDEREKWAIRNDVHAARTTRRGAASQAELKRVAEVYREHVERQPTRMVQLVLGYSQRTAARRVEQARAAGLLPPTTPGKRKA